MKEKIESLLNISKSLDLIDIVTEVEFIRERLGQENTELIIPIVGEFSSGKTTLINSLTNSKKLETDIQLEIIEDFPVDYMIENILDEAGNIKYSFLAKVKSKFKNKNNGNP